jgi:hypothetical protein
MEILMKTTKATVMTPRWCLLFRITYEDGHVAECSARSWSETADEATKGLRAIPLCLGAVSLEIVAVLPWTADHDTRTTEELFASLNVAEGA